MMKKLLHYFFLQSILLVMAGTAHAQVITTIAGNGTGGFSGDGGAATSAELNDPMGVAVDDTGNVYIIDFGNNRLRKVNTSGVINTIAGTGTGSFGGDGGPAVSADIYIPYDVVVDHKGNIYICDCFNQRIRKIDTSGTITTVAGNGSAGFSGDGGAATSASLNYPQGVGIDPVGNIYIADCNNNRIRKVDTFGNISTIAGTGGTGYTGDGGLATSATFNQPQGVTADAAGNVYICDRENSAIRMINPSGYISTIAGTGTAGFSGDGGPATSAEVNWPARAVLDAAGNLFFTDQSNQRIRKINTSGYISTVAGDGSTGYAGDGGDPLSAEFNDPWGLTVDASGNIFIADFFNQVVRKITAAITTPTITISASPGDSICTGTSVTFTAATAYDTAHYQWLQNGIAAGSDSAGFTTSTITDGDSISCILLDGIGDTLAISTAIYMTVQNTPSAGTISGPASVCISSAITLTDTAAGGTWSATNGNASVSSSGIVTGAYAGTDTLVYTVTNACATSSTLYTVIVDSTPDATITAASSVCLGGTVILSAATPGGTWSSSDTSIATIDSLTGTLTTADTGIVTIYYSITTSGGCMATGNHGITIHAPARIPVTSPAFFCMNTHDTLKAGLIGGIWTSSDTTVAVISTVYEVDSTVGITTSIAPGDVTFTYTVTDAYGCLDSASYGYTIHPLPHVAGVTGLHTVCVGAMVGLSDSTTGGHWTISFDTVASVGFSSGIVSGVGAGGATVYYTFDDTSGCVVTAPGFAIHVLPLPDPTISGASEICIGSTATLADATTGGTWSASGSSLSVDSISGTITTLSTGASLVAYHVTDSNGCSDSATLSVTVNPLPDATITGLDTVCQGTFIPFTGATPGGSWSSSNDTIATVNAATGLVTGMHTGLATITYSVTDALGCSNSATHTVFVKPLPAPAISGSTSVCQGDVIALSGLPAGGTWNATNTDASVSTAGIVTGASGGTDTITYSLTNTCGTVADSMLITIIPTPVAGAILGPSYVCKGSSVTLTDAVPGGTWSVSNTHATITASGSSVTASGSSVGTDTVAYTVTNTCGSAVTTAIISVHPIPDPGTITGPDSLCSGTSAVLLDTVTGGTWTSTGTAILISSPAVIYAFMVGTDTIFYTVSSGGCSDSTYKVITSSFSPSAGSITGPSNICEGVPVTYTAFPAGGTWSATADAVATVSASGNVTGYATGTFVLDYTITVGACSATATQPVTVDPEPNITGLDSVCLADFIILNGTPAGGTWDVSNSNASVSGGYITPLAVGTDTVYYTASDACGTMKARLLITILPEGTCDTSAGVQNISSVTEMEVFPNPNNGTFTVELRSSVDEPLTVSLTNIAGQSVGEWQGATNRPINIGTHIPAGIYFVKVATAHKQYMQKIMVQQ